MSVRNTVKSIQDIMRRDMGVDGDAQRLSQLCWMFFLKIVDDRDSVLAATNKEYQSPLPKQLRWSTWAKDGTEGSASELIHFINNHLFPGLKALRAVGKEARRKQVIRAVFEDAHNHMKNGQLVRQVISKINEVDFCNLVERKHFGDIYEQLLNDLQAAGNSGEFYTPRGLTKFMVDRVDPKVGEIILDPSCGTGGFLTCSIRHVRDKYVRTEKQENALQGQLRAIELKPLPHMLCVTNMLLHEISDASFVQHANTLARSYESYGKDDEVNVIVTNPPFGASVPEGVEENFPANFRSRESADLFLLLIIRLLKKDGRAAVVLPNGSLSGEGVKSRIRKLLLMECNLHTVVRLPDSVFKPYASIGTNILFFEKGTPTKETWFFEHCVPLDQKGYSMTRPVRFEHFNECIEWWGGDKRKARKENQFAWRVGISDIQARGFSLDFKNPHEVVQAKDRPEDLSMLLKSSEERVAQLREILALALKRALHK